MQRTTGIGFCKILYEWKNLAPYALILIAGNPGCIPFKLLPVQDGDGNMCKKAYVLVHEDTIGY